MSIAKGNRSVFIYCLNCESFSFKNYKNYIEHIVSFFWFIK